MADELLPNYLNDCQTLLQQIDSIQDGCKETKETFIKLKNALAQVDRIDQNNSHLSTSPQTPQSLIQFFNNTTKHTYDALINEPEYFANLARILAITTRTTEWTRHSFGISGDTTGEFSEPDSVLEVARLACTLRYSVNSIGIECCMKIINNCCAADDDDANRSALIRRDGINILLNLALHDTNLDVLVSALYTVCMFHNVPSTVLPPSAYLDTNPASQDDDDRPADERPSVAIEVLGTAYRSKNDFMTFELLLTLHPKVSDHVQIILAELVELATQPALSGFNHIREGEGLYMSPWSWRCNIDGREYDTISLINSFVLSDLESMLPICRAVLNLLTQQAAKDALLRREDGFLISLFTIASMHDSDNQLSAADRNEIILLRKAFLKILYDISGSDAFLLNDARPPILMPACMDRLEGYMDFRQPEESRWSTRNHSADHGTNYIVASVCVIIAQLAGSSFLGDDPPTNQRLFTILISIFWQENRPDILYPALMIASRILRHPERNPQLLEPVLYSVQRLLTQPGVGLIVPLETVLIYKTVIRDQPTVIETLLRPGKSNTSIADDMLKLWNLTFDAGTKLEIFKFFLEMLRTVFPASTAQDGEQNPNYTSLLTTFKLFLSHFSPQIAETFTWTCLRAEPAPQRDHGWFGLAMLSTWSEARLGILRTIGAQQDFRDEMLRISESASGPVRGNLTLMISKLHESYFARSAETQATLKAVATNLGLFQVVRGLIS